MTTIVAPARAADTTSLIQSGKELLTEANFNKSKMKVWQIQGKRALEQAYDEEIGQEFDRIFGGGMVIRPHMNFYQEHYRPQIQRAVEFLESLLTAELPERPAKAPAPPSSPQSIQVKGGTVIVGNNNTFTNVTVKDMLVALEKDVEKRLPEGAEKRGALAAIKNLTTNETVAAVVGQTLGAFLTHAVK